MTKFGNARVPKLVLSELRGPGDYYAFLKQDDFRLVADYAEIWNNLTNVAFLPLTAPHTCKPSGQGCEMLGKLGDDQARARLR